MKFWSKVRLLPQVFRVIVDHRSFNTLYFCLRDSPDWYTLHILWGVPWVQKKISGMFLQYLTGTQEINLMVLFLRDSCFASGHLMNLSYEQRKKDFRTCANVGLFRHFLSYFKLSLFYFGQVFLEPLLFFWLSEGFMNLFIWSSWLDHFRDLKKHKTNKIFLLPVEYTLLFLIFGANCFCHPLYTALKEHAL